MLGLFLIASKGCSTPGHYGNNCSERCPEKCQEGRCYIINGTCLGCTPGWIGEYCNNSKKLVFFHDCFKIIDIHCIYTVYNFNTQRVMMDIMVWGALWNVLDIVRTTSLVITSMVHVTKDAMMDGLEKSVTQVDNFFCQWKYFFLKCIIYWKKL